MNAATDQLPGMAALQLGDVPRIPLHLISPDKDQVRRHFDEEALEQLAASIRVSGVVQPVVLQPLPGEPGTEVHYKLIAGERRWRASKLAGMVDIPAVVRTGLSEEEALALQVLENLQRANPSLAETAAGVARLDKMMGRERAVLALGMSSSWISLHVSVMELPSPVLALVQDRKLDVVETATALGTMVQEHPEHFRTAEVLALAQQGKLTRAVLREQHRFVREEAERNRQYLEDLEKQKQRLLLPPEPKTEPAVSPAKEPPAPQLPESSEANDASAAAEDLEKQEAGAAPTPGASQTPAPIDAAPQPAAAASDAAAPPADSPQPELGVEVPPAPVAPAAALSALALLLTGGEKVTAALTLGAEPGQLQCVVITTLGPEPASLSAEGKAARMRLAVPLVLKGTAETIDADLAAFIAGKVAARAGDLQAYQAAQQQKKPSAPKPATKKPAAKKPPPKAKPAKAAAKKRPKAAPSSTKTEA